MRSAASEYSLLQSLELTVSFSCKEKKRNKQINIIKTDRLTDKQTHSRDNIYTQIERRERDKEQTRAGVAQPSGLCVCVSVCLLLLYLDAVKRMT